MKIEELTAGQTVTLMLNMQGSTMNFDTKIQEVYPQKKMVLAEPIYRNDKVVTFNVKNLLIDLWVQPENAQPVLFKNITVALVKKPDNSLCYNIMSRMDGKSINRRNGYRCFIGTPITIQVGANHSTSQAILRNISISGFSIVTGSDVDLKENQVVHTVFQDRIEEVSKNYSFQLYGIIVRKEELQNGQVLYGCKLNNSVMGLSGYLSIKQRLELKRNSGNDMR